MRSFLNMSVTTILSSSRITDGAITNGTPRFLYPVTSRLLHRDDTVDGVYGSQFIYDCTVIKPECLEYGYNNNGDYKVEVKAGNLKLLLARSDISNVRRPYQPGDWMA